METPYIILPNVPKPVIAKPYVRPPSIPMPGDVPFAKSDWQKEYDKQKIRQRYMSDYNDPDAINSIADIVRSVPKSILSGLNFPEVVGKLGKDVLEYGKSWLDPIVELRIDNGLTANWNLDAKAFAFNRFQDFNEDVDLLDNLWKGYTMSREADGLQDRVDRAEEDTHSNQFFRNFLAGEHSQGVKGFQEALKGKNFDFDTQKSMPGNLAREIASPTGLATLLLTGGASSLGKASAATGTDLAQQISKRGTKKILTNYTGDMAKAVDKARKSGMFRKAFNASDERILETVQDFGEELYNTTMRQMRVLSATNKAKGVMNTIDSIGPMLAVKTQIVPAWKLFTAPIKGGMATINHYTKVMNSAAEAGMAPGQQVNLVSFVKSGGFYTQTQAHETLARATRDMGGEIPFDVGHLPSLAEADTSALNKIYLESFDLIDDQKLLDVVGDDISKISLDNVSQLIQRHDNSEIIKKLNQFAFKQSEGTYNSFKEYVNFVDDLYAQVGRGYPELTELHRTTQKLVSTLEHNDEIFKQIELLEKGLDKVRNYEEVSEAITEEQIINKIEDYLDWEQDYTMRRSHDTVVEHKRITGIGEDPEMWEIHTNIQNTWNNSIEDLNMYEVIVTEVQDYMDLHVSKFNPIGRPALRKDLEDTILNLKNNMPAKNLAVSNKTREMYDNLEVLLDRALLGISKNETIEGITDGLNRAIASLLESRTTYVPNTEALDVMYKRMLKGTNSTAEGNILESMSTIKGITIEKTVAEKIKENVDKLTDGNNTILSEMDEIHKTLTNISDSMKNAAFVNIGEVTNRTQQEVAEILEWINKNKNIINNKQLSESYKELLIKVYDSKEELEFMDFVLDQQKYGNVIGAEFRITEMSDLSSIRNNIYEYDLTINKLMNKYVPESKVKLGAVNAERMGKTYSARPSKWHNYLSIYNGKHLNDLVDMAVKDGNENLVMTSIKGLASVGSKQLQQIQTIIGGVSDLTPEMLTRLDELISEVPVLVKAKEELGIAKFVTQFAEMTELKRHASVVYNHLIALGSMREFITRLVNSDVPVKMQDKLMDAMNSFEQELTNQLLPKYFEKNKGVARVLNKDLEQQRGVQKVIDQLNRLLAQTNKRNFKLGNAAEAVFSSPDLDPKLLDEFNDLFISADYVKRSQHTAIADMVMSTILTRHILKDSYDPTVKLIGSDWEADALNPLLARPHQAGLYDASTKKATLFVRKFDRPDVLEDDVLLHKLYGSPGTDETTEEVRKLYNRIHYDGDIEAFYDTFGYKKSDKIEIVVCNTEEELYELYAKKYNDLHPDIGNMEVDIYNGLEYDMHLINKGYDKPLIHKGKIRDGLVLMKNKYKVDKLTDKQEELVTDLLYDYIGIRKVESLTEVNRLGNSVDRGVIGTVGDTVQTSIIPGLGKDFKDSFKVVIETLQGKNSKTKSKNFSDSLPTGGQGKEDDVNILLNVQRELRDRLKAVKVSNEEFGRYHIELKDVPKMLGDSEAYYEGIAKKSRSDYNIMSQLARHHDKFDVHGSSLIFTKDIDDAVIYKHFNIAEEELISTISGKYMTKMGDTINRLMASVKRVDYFATDEQIVTIRNYLKKVIDENKIFHAHAGVLSKLKDTKDPMLAYAQSVQMHAMLRNAIKPEFMEKINNFIKTTAPTKSDVKNINVEIYEYLTILKDPYIIKSYSPANYEHTFFEVNVDGQLKNIRDFVINKLDHTIFGLKKYIDSIEDYGITTPLKRVLGVLEPMLESVLGLDKYIKGISDIQTRTKVFNVSRASFEGMYAIQAFYKLKRTLSLEPEDMVRYLWDWSKTRMYIDVNDLKSKAFFRNHTMGKKIDLIEEDISDLLSNIIKNKQAYEDKGIIITRKGHTVAFELDRSKVEYYQTLSPYKISEDLDLTDQLDRISKPLKDVDEKTIDDVAMNHIRKGLEKMIESRKRIVATVPTAATSTMEKLDIPAYKEMLANLGEFSSKSFSTDELITLNRFDGMPFNHSVLGSIDTVRKALPSASYNPSKTMFNAARTLHDAVDTKMQFINLVFNESGTLAHLVDGIMTDEEVFKYLKANKQLKLAFIGQLGKGEPKVRQFIVNNVKDIAKAKEFRVVVMDHHTFTKTIQTVNHNKLPAGARILMKVALTPWKIGTMAYNAGTILRNLFDTSIKNVVTAEGDVEIVKYMRQTFADYFAYKNVGKMVAERMSRNGNIDAVTDEVFKTLGDNSRISRELYDEITFFKQNGPSSGMVRSLQKYYGDSLKTVYRKLNAEEMGLSQRDLKVFLSLPDMNTAKEWAKIEFKDFPVYQDRLLQARTDFQLHKKAYAMLEKYKGHELTVNKVVNAMKNKTSMMYWSEDSLKFYNDNITKVQEMSFNDDIITRIMHHPLVDNALTANADVEEILRISLYRYLRDQGAGVAETMSEITRTHFDYDNKTMSEMWGEMIIPFSTFRKNSFIYWMTELSKQPHVAQVMGKYDNVRYDRDDITLDDTTMNRALQYHINTGNIINDKMGKAMKTMPSMYDAMHALWDPVGYISEGTSPFIKGVLRDLHPEQYKNETDEDFETRKRRAWVGLLPLVGTFANRVTDDRHHFAYNLTLGTVLSDVKTPATKKQYRKKSTGYYIGGYPEADVGMRQWQEGSLKKVNLFKPGSSNVSYINYDYQINKSIAAFKRNGVRLSRLNTRPNLKGWNRLMTRSNKPRQSLRRLPKTRWTLPMRMYLVNYRVTKEFRP